MRCYSCKSEMKKTTTNYPYKESGLDNVVLNGITAYICPKCGEVNPVISQCSGCAPAIGPGHCFEKVNPFQSGACLSSEGDAYEGDRPGTDHGSK